MFSSENKVYSGVTDITQRNCARTKILQLVDPNRRVLDVGCAEGYMAEFLVRHRGCVVTGVELNPEAAKKARAFAQNVIVGDVENGALESLSGPFDTILFVDVLEHLRNPEAILTMTHRLLTDTGYILVSIPNVVHWDVRRSVLCGRFEYAPGGLLDDTHLRFFTYKTALKLFADSGFIVKSFDAVYKLPYLWRYPNLCDRFDRWINAIVRRYFRGVFGYQFVFKLASATHQRPGSELEC